MSICKEITAKIISAGQAVEILSPGFRNKHRIVFTNGCFDILHKGHIYLLSKAGELGDFLIVGLNSDASVTRLKGPGRPLNDTQSRAEVLSALCMIDRIIVFEEDTPLELIRTIRPDVLVKGGDYRKEEIVGYSEVVSQGGEVHTIPLLEGYSTSSIIERSV